MKKLVISVLTVGIIILFSYCSSSKKTVAAPLTYETNIMAIVGEKCAPCHIPEKGGRAKPLNTYEAVRKNIDNIIRRIQLSPEEKGFMPFKHDKLSDSTIAVFTQWKTDGLREK
ncbi:MAG: cytochrome c [Sphingobacteriales bacterium]|nr:cytochrome c [Sphingobacteriales bacterium]